MKDTAITILIIVFLMTTAFMVGYDVGLWQGTYESIVFRTETLDCVLKGAVDE